MCPHFNLALGMSNLRICICFELIEETKRIKITKFRVSCIKIAKAWNYLRGKSQKELEGCCLRVKKG